jgi:hypothetical protein
MSVMDGISVALDSHDGLSLASDIDDDKLSDISETSIRIALDNIDNDIDIENIFVQQQQSEKVIVQEFESVNTASSIIKVKRKYICFDCGSDFTTARRLRTHKTKSKTMICENKRQRKEDEASLPPHAAIGETFNGCIKKMNDLIKQNSSEEKIRSNIINKIDFISNRFFFPFRSTFVAMADTELSKANHEMRTYIGAIKKEDATYHARNADFYKKNTLFNNLTFTADDGSYTNYIDYLASLDNEDDIKSHMKVLSFLNDQLVYRLRIKSDAAIDVRETMKLIKPHFDDIMKDNDTI